VAPEAPPAMESTLVEIAVEELRQQRTFLSTDEAAALTLPAALEDEENLALDRVRRRRLWLYTALRDRFIGDGRPFDEWVSLIAQEEAAAGGETVITQIARQVLEWGVRSSDRGAMLGGFGAKAMRWAGLALLLFAAWSGFQGAGPFVVGVAGAIALALVAGSVAVGRRTAARREHLAQGLRERYETASLWGRGRNFSQPS
jgi:hypothetical protein